MELWTANSRGPADHEGYGDVVRLTVVIPGRCEASNPESRDSGSGAYAPSRNDGVSSQLWESQHCPASPPKPPPHPSPSRTPPSTCCARSASRKCSAIPARPNCRSSATGPTTSTTCWACRKPPSSAWPTAMRRPPATPVSSTCIPAAGVGHALGNIFTAYRNQTPLVITAGQQARSILPLQAFLYAERATEFPQPYVKYQRRAGARRGRAGGDRARLLRRDAAALRADVRIGAGRRLDPSDAAGRGPPRQPRARARCRPR